MTFRTRFAPSPTGYLHVGGARTALYCWLQARKVDGVFILRIEDTDRERSTDEAVNVILESMNWLGLDADEGPFYQTHQFDRYDEVIEQLLADDHAYYCYCSKDELDEMRSAQMAAKQKPKYDSRCRHRTDVPEGIAPVVRFKTPLDGETVINDLVRGEMVIRNEELDDLIIRRSDGTPTYNLTVVVDDADMNITHVIRGDDHINNTPRQINILNAMGKTIPAYAHVSMILGDDGARLSKRHGAVSVLEYRDKGFLPEALLNYLARLGWSYGDQEIFSVAELTEKFSIEDVNHSAASFDHDKLRWLNQQHMVKTDPQRLAALLLDQYRQLGIDTDGGPDAVDVVHAYVERAHTLADMAEMTSYLYQDFENFDDKAARKHLRPVIFDALTQLRQQLDDVYQWRGEAISAAIDQVASDLDLKMPKIAQPLRVAVTGSSSSPSIDVTLALTGKNRTLARLEKALDYIQARIQAQ